jgi:hypothetical protein
MKLQALKKRERAGNWYGEEQNISKKRQSIKQALNLQDKTQKAEDLKILQLNRPMLGLSMSDYVSNAWGKIIEEHNAES